MEKTVKSKQQQQKLYSLDNLQRERGSRRRINVSKKGTVEINEQLNTKSKHNT